MSNRRTSSGRRSTRRSSSGRVLHMTSHRQFSDLEHLIRKGPITYVLVYSVTCPHCHTYKPIWSELCRMNGKKANMVSMEARVYDKIPMSEQKKVSGVPTVLYVDKSGQISEVQEPRNREVMANAVRKGVTETEAATDVPEEPAVPVSSSSPASSEMVSTEDFTAKSSEVATPIPGTRVSESELRPLPAGVVQSGGNPWAAFLRQAAPAAMLVGAYAIARSSGLGRSTRRRSRSRR